MSDTPPPQSRNATVEALRKLSGSFDELAHAIEVIAREGAIAAEVAENAGNAAIQAVAIAREVRTIAKNIEAGQKAQREAFERFEIRVLKEFGQLARRVDVLESVREEGANGHG